MTDNGALKYCDVGGLCEVDTALGDMYSNKFQPVHTTSYFPSMALSFRYTAEYGTILQTWVEVNLRLSCVSYTYFVAFAVHYDGSLVVVCKESSKHPLGKTKL